MAKTTKLAKQENDVFRIDIPEEYITKLGWRSGHLLKIDANGDKLVIEKLSGFVGM